MKLTEQDINKLKGIGLITSTYPSKKIIEDLELDTVDLNKMFKYITHADSTEKIEQWLSEEPGPTPTKDSRYLTYKVLTSENNSNIVIGDWTTWDPASPPDPNALTVYYSVNDGEWEEVVTSYAGVSIPVHEGDEIRFKGNNSSYATAYANTAFVPLNCTVQVYGNIMSLIGGDDFVDLDTFTSEDVFHNFFAGYKAQGDTTIVDASDLTLPAITLTARCYAGMFDGCTSLTSAPSLPATTLAEACYSGMFAGCTSLTAPPEFYIIPGDTDTWKQFYFYMMVECDNNFGSYYEQYPGLWSQVLNPQNA